jgi:hypothetical protein
LQGSTEEDEEHKDTVITICNTTSENVQETRPDESGRKKNRASRLSNERVKNVSK